ncbi:hypothetical protein L202_07186 [Cryptococcus amylolentus CBS 6039]|uniref:Uncharacterized protein n=1 Tax=Cryptococcus amylolentus CBS 6039 TaxID=1295533 RepID=A0A1E3HEZ5_9TREE|nr:hypothetical protein L202_07186 [Cryptococcus amylolentus CBS 6039]ODN74884.1 hypothetical protein L202_07186 [Cryptococcus amylolentus CBS 6039]
MIVIDKDTILLEVPDDTPLTTHGIDDMMDFLAENFSFPHEFGNDTETLDFIWRYFDLAWDAIKDLPLHRRLQPVPKPPWLSREDVQEKLEIPLVGLGGINTRLAAFLEYAHGLETETATQSQEVTTPSTNVSSGTLYSASTTSRPHSQGPPRRYVLPGEASSSLPPIRDLEQEEEMSNVDEGDGKDEEHDEEERDVEVRDDEEQEEEEDDDDSDGSDSPIPDSNGKKDDPGNDQSGNLGGGGDGANPGMGGGMGGAANTTSGPGPGDGGSSQQQESSSGHAGGADQRDVARVGGNDLRLALEMGPRRLGNGKTSEEEILKTPIVDNHYSTRDVDGWLSWIPTFTPFPHDLLSDKNDNTLLDKPPSFSKSKGSNNTSEDTSLGMGEVEEWFARMAGGVGFKRKGQSATADIGEDVDSGTMKDEGGAQKEWEDRPEKVERPESPCASENGAGSDMLAFHDILLKRNIKFVLTEKSLFRAIVDNIKATPKV